MRMLLLLLAAALVKGFWPEQWKAEPEQPLKDYEFCPPGLTNAHLPLSSNLCCTAGSSVRGTLCSCSIYISAV